MPCKTHEEYISATGEDVKNEVIELPTDNEYIEIKTEIKAYEEEEGEDNNLFLEGSGSSSFSTEVIVGALNVLLSMALATLFF